jgi:ferrochelatase
LSFGGPESPDEVIPLLERVTRGRNVPPERLLGVAAHYDHFGGQSPINACNRALLAALRAELDLKGPPLSVYWGNRHSPPFLDDTLERMAEEGVRRAYCFVTSAFGSFPGCRQYLLDIAAARARLGPAAPEVLKLRTFHNHPGFIEANLENVRQALASLPQAERVASALVFTAHSIPLAMAVASPYQAQLRDACGLVAERVGRTHWDLAYQSRSGPPSEPWLGPDILEQLEALAAQGATHLVLCPIGFVSDHMEVVYDLDVAACEKARSLGLTVARAATVGCHGAFVAMIRELIQERRDASVPRRALGLLGPAADVCGEDCCPPPARPARGGPSAPG